jgi:hypothetical protein
MNRCKVEAGQGIERISSREQQQNVEVSIAAIRTGDRLLLDKNPEDARKSYQKARSILEHFDTDADIATLSMRIYSGLIACLIQLSYLVSKAESQLIYLSNASHYAGIAAKKSGVSQDPQAKQRLLLDRTIISIRLAQTQQENGLRPDQVENFTE